MNTTDKPAINIGVKKVPYIIWQRARHNAIASHLTFGDYLIAVLATCNPVHGKASADLQTQVPVVPGTDDASTPTVEERTCTS